MAAGQRSPRKQPHTVPAILELPVNSLPPNATTATLTTNWWATFVQTRCGLTTSTLNRDRAALLAFVGWSRDHGYEFRWPFFWMLLDTGARRGEVLNLRGGDIGVDADIVTFRSRPGSKSRGRERHQRWRHTCARSLR